MVSVKFMNLIITTLDLFDNLDIFSFQKVYEQYIIYYLDIILN
jgi:hypothetical protein